MKFFIKKIMVEIQMDKYSLPNFMKLKNLDHNAQINVDSLKGILKGHGSQHK